MSHNLDCRCEECISTICSVCHRTGCRGECQLNICTPKIKTTTQKNPKDIFGAQKVSITKLPAVAILHGAHAMMFGADKYSAYNWRDKKVIASIYVDAAMRHLLSWFEGEETAEDSGVHHLGHAIACAAILLDAKEHGMLVDDRPLMEDKTVFRRVLDRLKEAIRVRRDKEGK